MKHVHQLAAALAALAISLSFVSCGGGDGGPATIAVTGVAPSETALTLNVGTDRTLTAAVQPPDASNRGVNWLSDDTGVATVSGGGLVHAVANGTANVIVTTADGGKTAICRVAVRTPVAGVTVNPTALPLHPGDQGLIGASALPGSATNKAVAWASSNPAVATVEGVGPIATVTAVGVGTAAITASSEEDPGKTAACTVTVGLPVPAVTDVYVAGLVMANGTSGYRATLWKNFAPIQLTSVTTGDSEAASVCALGDDVYVVGYENESGLSRDRRATLWRVGADGAVETVRLPSSTTAASLASSVCASGGNVYIAGYSASRAMLWTIKGGDVGAPEAAELSQAGSGGYSVYAVGDDVYVAGNIGGTATLWTNGVGTGYPSPYGGVSHAYSVFVVGRHVFLGGYEDSDSYGWFQLAAAWADGEHQSLHDNAGNGSIIMSAFVADGIQYFAGYSQDNGPTDPKGPFDKYWTNHATLWKNGERIFLDKKQTLGYSVSVSGGDVYVAGFEQDWDTNTYNAYLWVNGEARRLSQQNSYAASVFTRVRRP
jgi:uncharacterized protein YjdB